MNLEGKIAILPCTGVGQVVGTISVPHKEAHYTKDV